MKERSQPPSQSSKTSIDPAVERAVIKAKCERDHLFFSRYFFKHRQGIKFRVNWHHVLIADTVQRVIDGELKNVVINVPPGSSKTELVAINLIARGLALNPRARFLHISYSDDLALLNSETARLALAGFGALIVVGIMAAIGLLIYALVLRRRAPVPARQTTQVVRAVRSEETGEIRRTGEARRP